MRLRVLHVIPSLDAADGGPSVMLPKMLQSLHAAGVRVEAACSAVAGTGAAEGVPPVRRFPRDWRLYKPSFSFARWCAAHVAEYDLVHIHALFSFMPNVAAWFARRCRVPYVIRPLGVLNQWGMTHRRRWPKRLSLRLLEGGLLRDAAAVHFTSQAEADEAALLGVPMRGKVIPLGIELSHRGDAGLLRARYPQLADGPVLLFLSRLDPKKNIEALLEAFAQISAAQSSVRLLICGNGERSYVDGLRHLLESRGMVDRIVLAGEVQGAEKASALAIADLFVLPSFSENFGIAAVEALAAGLPVVLSDGVPIVEEVLAAGAGWRCGTDAASLASVLNQALANKQRLTAMGDRARALAERSYSLDAMGQRLKALYQDIITAGSAAGARMGSVDRA